MFDTGDAMRHNGSMIERYTGAVRFDLNNEGQWVSYERHAERMTKTLGALKMVIQRITNGNSIFSALDCEQIDNAFYEYCDEIPGMYPIEGVKEE